MIYFVFHWQQQIVPSSNHFSECICHFLSVSDTFIQLYKMYNVYIKQMLTRIHLYKG